MATRYAKAAGGNWSASATWSATSSAGADSAGAPAATDDVIFDSGANTAVVVDTTTCVCKTLTCQAAANSITVTSAKTLGVSGNITFYSGMNLTGTGVIQLNTAPATLDFAGLTFPGTVYVFAYGTYTLSNHLRCGRLSFFRLATSFSGNYNIYCDYLYAPDGTWNQGYSINLTLTAGTSLNVSTLLYFAEAVYNSGYITIIKSGTSNSAAYLNYSGTAANLYVSKVTFTDIDASGSSIAICNWNGGTLTRTTGIYNATQSSFPAVGDVKNEVGYGGLDDDGTTNRLTGTYSGGGGVIVATPGMNGGIN